MKKSIIAAAAALFIAGMANADYNGKYDGIVHFNGEVTDQTCKVELGSALSKNEQTVTLPKVGKDALKNAGDVAGTTPFAINLYDCNAASTTQNVKAQFVFSSLVDVDNAYTLKNTATTDAATNVNLQLANVDAAEVIRIGDTAGDNVKATGLNNQATGTLRYNVQYYATGEATAGQVASQVEYNIVYE